MEYAQIKWNGQINKKKAGEKKRDEISQKTNFKKEAWIRRIFVASLMTKIHQRYSNNNIGIEKNERNAKNTTKIVACV